MDKSPKVGSEYEKPDFIAFGPTGCYEVLDDYFHLFGLRPASHDRSTVGEVPAVAI